MSLVLFGLLCATAQGQPSPLITGNNERGGGGIIVTTDFPTGPTVDFVPTGASNRGVLVLGNKVYYTAELPTDSIHVAPFNGGLGGPDIPGAALPNPRPGCGVQDLAYHDGYIYALTGQYTCSPTKVFKVAVGSTAWSAAVTIPDAVNSDGFTILENNGVVTFLINSGDGSCQYNEYDSTTGAATGNGFHVSGFGATCTGVDTPDSDTDGTHVLYFNVGAFADAHTILQATLTPTWNLIGPNPTQIPGGKWTSVEDISLVQGFGGTPGAANCHGKSVSELAKTFGGMPDAASALGYASVADLQAGVDAFCSH
jgi:hypothetical protein